MSIATKWSVSTEPAVLPDDLGPDGAITDAAIERWATAATTTYLAQCPKLQARRADAGLVVRTRVDAPPGAARLGGAPNVAVTATATEVLPNAFVIAVRVRPLGSESTDHLDLRCAVRLEDPATGESQPIDNEIRDELIALEHAARHYN